MIDNHHQYFVFLPKSKKRNDRRSGEIERKDGRTGDNRNNDGQSAINAHQDHPTKRVH